MSARLFRDKEGEVFCVEPGQEFIIKEDWTEMSSSEIEDFLSPTEEQVALEVRYDRDNRLTKTDWVVIKSQETGQPVPPEWAAYRQALRDITEQPGFPLDVVWPTAPGGN